MRKIKGRKLFVEKVETSEVKPVLDTYRAGETKKIKVHDDGKSKIPATIFGLIVLLLGIYVIYDQFINDYKPYNRGIYTKYTEMKKDTTKDFVYFENETEIMRGLVDGKKYVTKDIVININTNMMKSLEQTLNKQRETFELEYEYVNSEVMDVQNCYNNFSTYNTNTEYLKSFSYRDYELYESEEYITIMVIDKSVVLCSDDTSTTMTNYIISKETGEIVSEDAVLKKFNADKRVLVHNSLVGLVDENIPSRTAIAIKEIEDPITYEGLSYVFVEDNCIGVKFDMGSNISIVPDGYDLLEESKICKGK